MKILAVALLAALIAVSGCITGGAAETTTTLSAEQIKAMDYRNCMSKCSEMSACSRYRTEEECSYLNDQCKECVDALNEKYG